MLNEANALERVIDRKIANSVGRRTRTSGTVSRIETDGTVYVLFDGATDDTLVAKTTATVKPGDLVTVRVENGVATIEGNVSDPAASSVRLSATHETAAAALGNAQKASEAATSAQASADSAASAAASAQGSANDAAAAASNAQESADDAARAASVADGKAAAAGQAAETAQRSANQASAHATNALNQLGIVQDVVGVLGYAAEHGSFDLTSDTSVHAGKVYFTYDSQSGDYAPVIDPQESALSTYYELTYSDNTMGDFIMSHLAVTQRGLWVLPSGMGQASDGQYAPGYKMLLSSGGSYIYDASGALVRSDTASGTDFSSGRRWHVGGDDAYILYTPASGSAPASLVIGGANVQLGSSKTLSQWEADMQQAVDDAAAALDSATLVITSTAGNLFKNGTESTVLQVAVFPNGGGRLDTIADVRARFGAGAYIEWRWRHDAEGTWGTLATSDPHLSNGGMWLTVTPVDVESKTSFEASLVVP